MLRAYLDENSKFKYEYHGYIQAYQLEFPENVDISIKNLFERQKTPLRGELDFNAELVSIRQEIKSADIQEEKPSFLKIVLSLEGDFPTSFRYLTLLENMSKYTRVQKISINSQRLPFATQDNPLPSTSLETLLELIVYLKPAS